MSMKEGWRSVSTRCGGPFAMGQPGITGPATGELMMQELSVDNWDTKTLASLSSKDASRTSANVNFLSQDQQSTIALHSLVRGLDQYSLPTLDVLVLSQVFWSAVEVCLM